MPRPLSGRILLALSLGLAGLILLAAPAGALARGGAGSFRIGAAREDTTPPPFSAADDPAAFPSCPRALYTGARAYAFEEPYLDVNHNGRYDSGELYCDANRNGHYDGIYISGGADHLAARTHDPLDARALSITSGSHTVVVVSVVAQGIFQNVIERIRALAQAARPGITDVVVSANHNESSPDTVGIYGAPDLGGFGANSGQDYYYLAYLERRAAQAAVRAYDRRRPAELYAQRFGTPKGLRVVLSKNFPTTDDAGAPAAIDPTVGVLQARDRRGRPIATVMSLAAHNQEIGHAAATARDLSSDWPGYFHRALERRVPGMAMFLVADNGSEEDPITAPPVSAAAHPECRDSGCYAQAAATGTAWARAVAREARGASRVRFGAVRVLRRQFFVPIENSLFKAAAAIGLFGQRATYLNGREVGRAGPDLRTEAGLVDVGPDLQLMLNPGEAFPALLLGSPWGIEDAGCPDRPNPPVPAWSMRARFRFQVGLADDFIGYEIPAWGNSSEEGIFPTTCFNDSSDKDPRGHQHKLEDEGVGPTASNAVATGLAALVALPGEHDPLARVVRGRFLLADGTLSRRASGAIGVVLAGGRRLLRSGAVFIDAEGRPERRPGRQTRGMLVRRRGRVYRRYYLDLYPAFAP